jgi:hypothetical protein
MTRDVAIITFDYGSLAPGAAGALRQEFEAEQAREKAATVATAQSIIDRLAPDDLHFVMEALSYDVLDELFRLRGRGQ